MQSEQIENWENKCRGDNESEYKIYLAFADNGNGGDITRNGEPLLTFEQWLDA